MGNTRIEPSRPSVAVAATAVNRILLAIGPIFLVPLFVRYLQAEEYGLWITILSITSYYGFLNLGMPPVVAAMTTREHARGSVGNASPTISAALAIQVGVCLVAWAVTTGILVWVCLGESGFHADTCIALWIATGFFLATLPSQLAISALRGCKRVAEEQVLGVWGTVLRYGGMAAALLMGFKLVGIAVVHGAAGLLVGLATWARLRSLEPAIKFVAGAPARERVEAVLRPSFWFMVLQVGGVLTYSVSPVVIGTALGAASVPAYSVPIQLIMAFQGFASVVTSAFTPHLISALSSNRDDESRRMYSNLLTLSMAIASIGCVGVWVGGLNALEILGGKAVVPERETMLAMGLMIAIQCSLFPADAVLVGLMRHKGYAVLAFLEGLLNLSLSLWWVNYLGALGVILASIAARIATNFWYLHWMAGRSMALSSAQVIPPVLRGFVLPVLFGLGAAGACEWSRSCPWMLEITVACAVTLLAAMTLSWSSVKSLYRVK